MLIKSITIKNWDATGDPYNRGGGRYLFYDENNDLIEAGNLITNGNTSVETDNFLVTCYSYFPDSNVQLYNAIRTDDKNVATLAFGPYVSDILSANDFLKIEFKTPKTISRIECCPKMRDARPDYSSAHALDVIITSETNIEKNFHIEVTVGNVFNEIEEIIDPFIHDINEIGTIESTINTNINNIQTINSLSIKYDMPTDTNIKIALNNDGRNTYKIFDSGNWINIDKNDVSNNGMPPSVLSSISASDLQAFLPVGSTLDAYCVLSTNNKYLSPVLYDISLVNTKLTNKNDLRTKFILIDNFNWVGDDFENAGGRFLFYDIDDNLVESGNLISQTNTSCETDNFIVTCSGIHNNDYTGFGCYNAIRTDEKTTTNNNFAFILKQGDTNSFLKIEFKTPTIIKKVVCSLKEKSTLGNYANAHKADINFTYNTNETDTYTIEHSVGSVFNEIDEIYLKQGILNKVYDNNEAKIETNTNTITGFSKIDSLNIIANEPTNTKLRFAISNDNKTTWYAFKNGSWNIVNESDIINNGNTLQEMQNLTSSDLNVVSKNKDVDIVVKMITTDSSITPSISSIEVNCVK